MSPVDRPAANVGGAAKLRVLTDETKSAAAQFIADRLIVLCDGRDIREPATWFAVAEENGCRILEYCAPGAGRGEYSPMDTESGRGIIAVNTGYEPLEVARACIHELAHHALWIWRPVLLPDASDGFMYEGSPIGERHAICRRVEALILG